MNVAVCDDNPEVLEAMQQMLTQIALVNNSVGYSSLEAFFQAVSEGAKFDAALMDIDWNEDTNGMDAAERLLEASPQTKVIYITGFNEEYSQQILLHKANLCGYLTKPVDQTLLTAYLQLAAAPAETDSERQLVFHSRGKPLTVPLDSVIYIESHGHNVLVHTYQQTITLYGKLSAIEAELPEDFMHCHKSFIVNMRKIRRFQQTSVVLENGKAIPISRNRLAASKAQYFRFMGHSF